MPVTIKEVAQRAGVSIGTVSNVLNNKQGEYRSETRAKVLEAVRALNYHPNRTARNLVQRETHCLGMCFVDQSQTLRDNPYVADVLDGLVMAARHQGYNITLYTAHQPGEEQQTFSVLMDQRVDALCLIAPDQGNPLVGMLAATDLPFIVVGVQRPYPGVNWIDVDNAKGARLAVEHLIQLGHRRIVHFAGQKEQLSAVRRAEAFEQAMKASGLPFCADRIVLSGFVEDGARQAAYQLMRSPDPPTAIFAASDQIALGVLAAAHDLKLCVPEQLSIVGFDDIRDARLASPPLTTVRQPVREIGFEAAIQLISILRGEQVEPVEMTVAPELIVRGTTCPPCY